MVEARIEDGVRIAELFASEITGRSDGPLGALSVTDAVPDVEPTVDGARAYDIAIESPASVAIESSASAADERVDSDGPAGSVERAAGAGGVVEPLDETGGTVDAPVATVDPIASVYVHEDRAHVAFRDGPDAAHEAATERGLRTRPKATQPPQTLVFLESGAAVKRGVSVLEAVARSSVAIE